MKLLQRGLILSTLILTVAGCGIGPLKMAGAHKFTKEGVISFQADWVKDKPKKFDVSLHLTNLSDKKTLLIFMGDMTCARGDQKGQLHDAGSRTLDLRANESRSIILTCVLPEENKGDFSLTFAKIYDNPSLDSKTPGATLLEGVSWTQGSREGKELP